MADHPIPELPIPEQADIPADVFERVVTLRRDLHRHPELSWEEERTAARIAAHLERLGIEHRCGVAVTGIVAEIPGQRDGPRIALRADLDALPVHEETGLPFASVNDGIMHACGHDGHAAILVGAAELLLREAPPPLPVRLIWQPAEERAQGAARMIKEGVLEGVAAIFGGHVDRHYEPGTMAISDGCVNAATDLFSITIRGQGGHGARPHEALDAVVAGSLLVTALQTIVSREVDPARPSVLSVGSFHAGTAANVIAAQARLQGTIRCHDAETRKQLQAAIGRISRAVADLHGADVEYAIVDGTPAVMNHTGMAELAREAALAALGDERVLPFRKVNMGGEDFAYFNEVVPGCYVRFGARVPGLESFPAHSSQFDIDERALATGARWFAEVARVAGAAF